MEIDSQAGKDPEREISRAVMIHCLWLFVLFQIFFNDDLYLRRKGVIYMFLEGLSTPQPLILCTFGQLWVSVTITVYCKN